MRLAEHELVVRKLLTEAQVDSPGLCARLLTAYAAGLDKTEYILAWDRELDSERAALLAELVGRRAKGEPLAYILGAKEFYGFTFVVSRDTLIPRPETELLIELAINLPGCEKEIAFADLGCGSGCIGLSLLKLRSAWRGVLLDNSLAALKISQLNAQRHSLNPHILAGDLRKLPFAAQSLDLVVSNPPYIGREETASVMGETLAYEPHAALFSERHGLAHLEAVILQARRCLKPGGRILLEHGAGQGLAVAQILAQAGFEQIKTHRDLAGLPRCASAAIYCL